MKFLPTIRGIQQINFKLLNEEIEIAYYLNLETRMSRILTKMGRSNCLWEERMYLGNCEITFESSLLKLRQLKLHRLYSNILGYTYRPYCKS